MMSGVSELVNCPNCPRHISFNKEEAQGHEAKNARSRPADDATSAPSGHVEDVRTAQLNANAHGKNVISISICQQP